MDQVTTVSNLNPSCIELELGLGCEKKTLVGEIKFHARTILIVLLHSNQTCLNQPRGGESQI